MSNEVTYIESNATQLDDYNLDDNDSILGCSVSVNSTHNNTMTTYYSKQVVVTVPLAVLESNMITFFPPLLPSKKIAISKVGKGLVNKVVLIFTEQQAKLWPDFEFFSILSKNMQTEKGKLNFWMNGYKISGTPALVGFALGIYFNIYM